MLSTDAIDFFVSIFSFQRGSNFVFLMPAIPDSGSVFGLIIAAFFDTLEAL